MNMAKSLTCCAAAIGSLAIAWEAGAVTCEPADLNGDNVVDGGDLGIMLAAWNGPGADLNADGTTNGADLGLLLGAWGAVDTSVICLRRAAGAAPAWTNGNYSFNNGGPIEPSHPCVSQIVTPVVLTAPADTNVRLEEWRVINGRASTSGDPSALTYFDVMVWNDLVEAGQNSCAGTVAQVVLGEPDIQPWGFTIDFPPLGVQPTYEFRFDLGPANIVIPAGESRVVVVRQKWAANGTQGVWGTMESKYAGPSDYQVTSAFPPPYYSMISLNLKSLWDGVLAVDVTAVPVP